MNSMKILATPLLICILVFVLPGCTKHEVEIKPVEIKPIHITIDVNVKIDKELEDFFGDIDEEMEEAAETTK